MAVAHMDRSLFCLHEGSYQGYPMECELPKRHRGNHLTKAMLPDGLITWSAKTAVLVATCSSTAYRVKANEATTRAAFFRGETISISSMETQAGRCILPNNHAGPHQTWAGYFDQQRGYATKPTITTIDPLAHVEEISPIIPIPEDLRLYPTKLLPVPKTLKALVAKVEASQEVQSPPASRPLSLREQRRKLLKKQQERS